MAARKSRSVDSKLLEILVAPGSGAPLRYDAEAQELISDRDGLAFPIRDGIPIMLLEEARPVESGPQPVRLAQRKAERRE